MPSSCSCVAEDSYILGCLMLENEGITILGNGRKSSPIDTAYCG